MRHEGRRSMKTLRLIRSLHVKNRVDYGWLLSSSQDLIELSILENQLYSAKRLVHYWEINSKLKIKKFILSFLPKHCIGLSFT